MKTTDSKDLIKINQILPIMQEYFGKSMNLGHIKLMTYMLTLCAVQTVSLHKLTSAILIGRNTRLSWIDSSDFLGMTASNALCTTARLAERSASADLTTTGFDTISVSGRIFGLSSPHRRKNQSVVDLQFP